MSTLLFTMRIFWRRLPHIALYIVVFYALFFVAQQLYYREMPGSYFLNYYSVNVPNGHHYEHEAVPFTVCRDKKGNYPVRGYRIIYRLPNEVSRSHAQQVANYPIDGQITQNKCSDVSITPKSFDHTVGSYYFKTVLNFRVDGYDKQVTFESNTYTIEKKVLTPAQLEQKIEELQKEIEQLKVQLEMALNGRQNSTTTTTTNTPATATAPASSSTSTTTTSTPNPALKAPVNDSPRRILGIPLCLPLVNICANE